MYKEIQIRIKPEERENIDVVKHYAARGIGIAPGRIRHIDILKQSIDARQKTVIINLSVGVHIDKLEEREKAFEPQYRDVSKARPVVIVGAGPAGLFAALRLIEKGLKPVILERGKAVDERKKDLNKLYTTRIVDEDSNFGFGEGGAGTFSDGKLFTRSNKRGNIRRVLEILVFHGADPVILIDSHPHIGSDKLPKVITNIRKTIEKYGGEIRFNTRVTDLIVKKDAVAGVVAASEEIPADRVILATGHSARDIYRMLHRKGIAMETKDFAIGLRLEHLQHDIDRIRYHNPEGRGPRLPAAEYRFVTNIDGRGVYSFCMCPGGIVVPATTAPGQQVVNGMSSSGRNTRWANSAIVTSIGSGELTRMGYHGLFAGLEFQETMERKAWQEGGNNLFAPAQTLTDFLIGRFSNLLPTASYKPGVSSSLISEWLPEIVYKRLREGMTYFGKQTKGFITEHALLLGIETRTSAPLKIPREDKYMHHPMLAGLYPCGEGAGYSGGIISAALDGEKCADAVL